MAFYEDMTPDEIKQHWLSILEGEDPDEFTTPKTLNDGHVRGSAFSYKQGLCAALKGEGDNPTIADDAFHDGWLRMIFAMRELGIEGAHDSAAKVRMAPAHARGLWTSATEIDKTF